MEKEINIEKEEICINFFFEGITLSQAKLSEFQDSLNLMAMVYQNFKNKILNLDKFSINLNITLCDDKKIVDLNSEFRAKENLTDVLSFPLQENIRDDQYDKIIPELELGDIYVCESVCTKQAQEFELSFQEEFIHLCTHGFLHVCGYDHEESEEEQKIMEDLEVQIIKDISKIKKGDS